MKVERRKETRKKGGGDTKLKTVAGRKEERSVREVLAKELVCVVLRDCFRTMRNREQRWTKRKAGSMEVTAATVVEELSKEVGGLLSSLPFESHSSTPFVANVDAQN